MKKTILVTTSTFPRWKDDTIPSFVYYLSKQLKKSFNIVVLAPHYPGSKSLEYIEGIKIYRYKYFYPESMEKLCYGSGIIQNIKSNPPLIFLIPFLIILGLYSQYKITKKENIDIVHAHWILPQGFFAVFLNKIFRLPIITTAHIGDLSWNKFFIIRLFLRYTLKNSTYVTANSSYTKQQITAVLPIKVTVIPMGIDINHFKIRKSNFLRKNYNINGPIILFVGRLVEKKGLIYLVRAVPDLLKQFSNLNLFIIGEGKERKYISKEVNKLNLNKHVTFLGSIRQTNLPDYYSSSDILVVPSILTKKGDTEGLGVVILEAMACGKPVIATNVGGIVDIIKDNETGLLVKQKSPQELSNKIIYLLKNKKLMNKVSKKGRLYVINNFSWDLLGKQFIQLLHSNA